MTPAEDPKPTRRLLGLQLCLLLLLLTAVYLPVRNAGFIWDDDDYILHNELLVEDGGLQEIWNPRSPRNPQYYPLVFTTFWLERQLWGENPLGYHLVNVVLHALNVSLLLFLLQRLEIPGAWIVAGLFAVHPVHVESVAWVSERKNVLSGFLYLLSALSFFRYHEHSRRPWLIASLACFGLALLAKTVTASLPIALALVLWWKGARFGARTVIPLAAMVAVGFLAGMHTRGHEAQHVLSETSVLHELTIGDRLLIAGRAFWFYPSKLVWPADLAFIYPRWNLADGATWPAIFPLLVAVLAGTLLVLWRRGAIDRGPLAAVGFYGVTIFPALGFVNVAPMRFSFVADHFQYLASLGILVLIAAGVLQLPELLIRRRGPGLRRMGDGLGITLILGLSLLTYRQVGYYQDLGTLWGHTARLNPESPMVQNNHGVWLQEQGRHDEAAECFEAVLRHDERRGEFTILALSNLARVRLAQERWTEARSLADRALAIHPEHAHALYLRARALFGLQQWPQSERALRDLLAIQPDPRTGRAAWDIRRRIDDYDVWVLLGRVERGRGRLAEAEKSYRQALALDPGRAKARIFLGNLLGSQERFEEAAEQYRQVVIREPEHGRAHLLLAHTLDFLERDDEAVASFETAIRLYPDHVPAYLALGDLHRRKGSPERALEVYQRALEQVSPTADLHYQRGLTLESLGRIPEAIASHRAAVGLDPDHEARRRLAALTESR